MALGFGNYFVRKWVTMRMAAEEFGFKQPFEIKEEYTIMKSVLFFSLFPIELIFVFGYARIYGSLSAYSIPIILAIFLVNFLVSNLVINSIKGKPVVEEAMAHYRQLDYASRKKLYSFRNAMSVISISLLPWAICALAIAIICIAVPR